MLTDCVKHRTGGKEVSTGSSLKEFCCERDWRNGRAREIKGEFKIRDISTSLQADENIPSRGRN